jgi:hypothetical protein
MADVIRMDERWRCLQGRLLVYRATSQRWPRCATAMSWADLM